MERRQQRYLSAVVGYGIALAAEGDTLTAARYMAERQVPIQVAKRVLTRPAQRRSH
jgi:hypothetical protein